MHDYYVQITKYKTLRVTAKTTDEARETAWQNMDENDMSKWVTKSVYMSRAKVTKIK